MSIDDVLELNATEEAKWLHGLKTSGSQAGYFVVGRKIPDLRQGDAAQNKKTRWQQKAYGLSAIETILGKLIPSMGEMPGDTYITQSTFAIPNRKTASFSRVQSAWVDLDYYNSSYPPERWAVIKLEKIQAHITALGLPAPSLIIDSGRGAYVKWIFHTPTHDLPAWNMMQQALTVLFTPLECDAQARDVCRVLRCLKSVNSKNAAAVNVIAGSGKEYDFRVFAKLVADIYASDIGPHVIQGSSARAKSQAIAGKTVVQTLERAVQGGDLGALEIFSKMHEPIMLENLTRHTLNWSRFTDLRDLVLMRGGFEVGQRNNMLLWMVNSLAQAKVINSANWDEELNNLIAAFPIGEDFNPMESGYLNTVHSRLIAEEQSRANNREPKPANRLYWPSNRYLISQLRITMSEQVKLRTIISREVKNERRRNKRDLKAPGRSQRRQERQSWHDRVSDLIDQKLKAEGGKDFSGSTPPKPSALGIKIVALADELGVERSVLSKFLKSKISDYFNTKCKSKTKSKSKVAIPRICPIVPKAPEDTGCTDQLDKACAVILEIRTKQQRTIEQVREKERAQGKNRLASMLEKIRARADLNNMKDQSPEEANAPTNNDGVSVDLVDGHMLWAKEKVSKMANDSDIPLEVSASVSPTSLLPRLVLKPGMFAQSQKPALGRASQSMGQHAIKNGVERHDRPSPQIPRILPIGHEVVVVRDAVNDQCPPKSSVISRDKTQFFVGKRSRPKNFPSPCLWRDSPELPLNTYFEKSEWIAAAAEGRYFVVEVRGGKSFDGLVRIINSGHPDHKNLRAGKDIYGEILQLPNDDESGFSVAKTLNGCVLIGEGSKHCVSVPEALEERMCVFFGQSFYLSRPPVDYIVLSSSQNPPRLTQFSRDFAPRPALLELKSPSLADKSPHQEQEDPLDKSCDQDGFSPAP